MVISARVWTPCRNTTLQRRVLDCVKDVSTVSNERMAHQTADLINWPEGLRPKSGNITKSALLKLKVSDLKEELEKRELQTHGTKQDLVQKLLEAIHFQIQTSNHSENTVRLKKPKRIVSNAPTQENATLERPKRSSSSQISEESVNPVERKRSSLNETNGESVCLVETSDKLYKIPVSFQSNQEVYVHGKIPSKINSDDPSALLGWLLSNTTRLQLVFLGTSSWSPTNERNLPSIAIRTNSDVWIFDAGEDTQRQCMKHPLLRPGKISRIFLTSANGDGLLGVPGILCTIAASREQGTVSADQPVHVYGPQGTGQFLTSFMELSDTFLEMPVIVHELSKEPSDFKMHALAPRAKLWKIDIPPDGLNYGGFYDARLDSKKPLSRAYAKPGRKNTLLNTVDTRAGFRPMEIPLPGDPSRYPLSKDALQWTLMISSEFLIKIYELDSDPCSFGYRIEEARRAGNLDVEKAKSLGVQEGIHFGILKKGGTVMSKNGELITSDMVLSPDLRGRTITILGETSNTDVCMKPSKNADYLILPIGQDPFQSKGLTVAQALKLAKTANVSQLIFGRIHPSDEETTESLALRSREGDLVVISAFDLYTHVVEANVSI